MTARRVYWWPVTVRFPDPDPAKAGQLLSQTFKARFREIPREEAQRLLEEIAELAPAERAKREFDQIIAVTEGWDEDVVDDAGQSIPFSADALREALQSSFFRIAIYRAFADSCSGEAARLGN